MAAQVLGGSHEISFEFDDLVSRTLGRSSPLWRTRPRLSRRERIGGVALLDASSLTGAASGALLGALALALIAALSLAFVLSKRVIKPVDELAKFSERLAAGDSRARADLIEQ